MFCAEVVLIQRLVSVFHLNGGILGPSELKFDPHEELWEYISDDELADDDDFAITSVSSGTDSESDLDDLLPEEEIQCVYNLGAEEGGGTTIQYAEVNLLCVMIKLLYLFIKLMV
jgi:hypothetical protein